MDAIADRFADRAVRSVFVYTREAHPGELYRHHSSMDGKRENARALRSVVGLKRQVLLDSLDGAAHHAYGLLPNMTWIFGRGGLILYKSAWTDPDDVAESLTRALDGLERRVKGDKLPFYRTPVLAGARRRQLSGAAGAVRPASGVGFFRQAVEIGAPGIVRVKFCLSEC